MAVAIWIALWVASIVVGFVLYHLAGPAIPGMDAKTDQYRKGILQAGFFPCFGANIITSLILFGMYKARSHGAGARQIAINDRLGRSGGLSAPPPPKSGPSGPDSDNPFL